MAAKPPSLWIVGYGNPQRRDDGTGYRVAERLNRFFREGDGVEVRAMHQLDPALVEELREADEVLFVDASVDPVEGGRAWHRVLPEMKNGLTWTHDCPPGHLLGLLQSIYARCPEAWMVSIQGDDFGLGEGLSEEGRKRVRKVTREIASHVARKTIDKPARANQSYSKRERGSPRWP